MRIVGAKLTLFWHRIRPGGSFLLLIPSLALALGVLTGSGKAFEALYVVWMYLLTQNARALDFAGIIPDSPLYIYAPLALLLIAVSALARWRQIQAR